MQRQPRRNKERRRWLGKTNIGAASSSRTIAAKSLPKDIGLRNARVPIAINSGDADEKSKACDKEV